MNGISEPRRQRVKIQKAGGGGRSKASRVVVGQIESPTRQQAPTPFLTRTLTTDHARVLLSFPVWSIPGHHSAAKMRGLAPGLVDGIIDHLDFSGVESTAEWMLLRKTLKACSLVNSRFRPRSQFHILSNVTADSAWDDWSIQALSNLLRSSTHIGPYIKRLGLYLGDELEGTEGQGIAHIVSCATRLITIDFSGCSPLGHGRPKPWQQYPLILRTA
ncbi:hypothetical protein B0H11DRAFT_259358 [Mycena galericulata]|nr:hypothetical protein B0H11DRAFT_259358 [Mycena galericulata]